MGLRLLTILLAMIALCGAAPAWADEIVFSGTVTYRERVVLPPEATLTITLVHLPDASAIASARAALGDRSGSPLSFSLGVHSELSPTRSLGLTAQVEADGRILFQSVEPVPVALGVQSGIVIPVVFNSATPTEPELPADEESSPLLGLTFMVTSIGGEPVMADTRISLNFAADGGASGRAGCNNYFTEADFVAAPIAFGPIAGTRMACAPPIMDQETRFFAALAATRDYRLNQSQLLLLDAAGVPLVGLVQTP